MCSNPPNAAIVKENPSANWQLCNSFQQMKTEFFEMKNKNSTFRLQSSLNQAIPLISSCNANASNNKPNSWFLYIVDVHRILNADTRLTGEMKVNLTTAKTLFVCGISVCLQDVSLIYSLSMNEFLNKHIRSMNYRDLRAGKGRYR